jgi:hypothetical protein
MTHMARRGAAEVCFWVGAILTLMAAAVPVAAQTGPGCHVTMNQAACVACVKKHLPDAYDPKGSARWCARMIAERRAQFPNTTADEKIMTVTRAQCIRQCIDRGPGRTATTCDPWCAPGCRNSETGKRYCVRG